MRARSRYDRSSATARVRRESWRRKGPTYEKDGRRKRRLGQQGAQSRLPVAALSAEAPCLSRSSVVRTTNRLRGDEPSGKASKYRLMCFSASSFSCAASVDSFARKRKTLQALITFVAAATVCGYKLVSFAQVYGFGLVSVPSAPPLTPLTAAHAGLSSLHRSGSQGRDAGRRSSKPSTRSARGTP